MDIQDPSTHLPPRAGEAYRLNYQRFFHVMNQGWYIHTREGVKGPYLKKEEASNYLEEYVFRLKPDPSDSWRMS